MKWVHWLISSVFADLSRKIMSIPRLSERIECMQFRRRLDLDIEEVRPDLDILRNASRELRSSSKFKQTLQVRRHKLSWITTNIISRLFCSLAIRWMARVSEAEHKRFNLIPYSKYYVVSSAWFKLLNASCRWRKRELHKEALNVRHYFTIWRKFFCEKIPLL